MSHYCIKPTVNSEARYDFTITAPGSYALWDHHGYESVRTPFAWRMDGGDWHEVGRSHPCHDLTRLDFWCEVAWLELGRVELAEGRHTLAIRAESTVDEQKKPRGINLTLDAFCLAKGAFVPQHRFKPDAEWREDIDRRAEAQVFTLAPPAAGERSVVELAGLWQIARYDETEVVKRTEGIASIPPTDAVRWLGIPVPGTKNARADLELCHRLLYRTRVRVPAAAANSAFVLHFPCNSMITTVFVNGVRCGSTAVPLAPWDCDVSAAVRPGQDNEIVVGIKDTYYAWMRGDIVTKFVTPIEFWAANWSTTGFDFPVARYVRESGMLVAPTLMATGPAYAADVFAIPSVQRHDLTLQVTLANPGPAPLAVSVDTQLFPVIGGTLAASPAKRFSPFPATIPPRGQTVVALVEPWPDAVLWWPDAPQLYVAVTAITAGGTVIDTIRTTFGFREWSWDGPQFRLNGVPWHFRGNMDLADFAQPGAVARYKHSGRNHVRLWGPPFLADGPAGYRSIDPTLDALDAGGLPARWTGIMDGEAGEYGLAGNAALGQRWIEQTAAWVKGYRNHPAIFIWSIENEVTYINARNWGLLDQWEPVVKRCWEVLRGIDPTRPVMVDGGRALRDRSLPVYGCHYDDATAVHDYPDDAYTKDAMFRAPLTPWVPWPIARDKPIYYGETCFPVGSAPAWYAGIGGEQCFLGFQAARPTVQRFLRMLSEGFRWSGINFTFWAEEDWTRGCENTWQEVVLLCRQWNSAFPSGGTVALDLRLLNDSRCGDPLTAGWQLIIDGVVQASDRRTITVAPGTASAWPVAIAMPRIAGGRKDGELVLTCARGDREIFRDTRPIAVLDPDADAKPAALAPGDLIVVDPLGQVARRLHRRGIAFTPASSLDQVPAHARVVVVGANALSARAATDPRWQGIAARGGRVLVLDQDCPLQCLALPADLEVTTGRGRIAFPETLEHPAFAGLAPNDFCCWSGDQIAYRNAYTKGSHGAISLVQCEEGLNATVLDTCAVGDGLIVPCQLLVGTKLDTDPVAQRLFDNLLNYAAAYAPVRVRTAAMVAAGSPVDALLTETGIVHDHAVDLPTAFAGGYGIVVAPADPALLAQLAAARASIEAFAHRGGYLMLLGLTKEGLASFNQLVGFQHLLRPFEMERVTLPAVRDPLLTGLSLREVVMDSGQSITQWTGDRFASDDVFTSVVDIDDVAPFATIPDATHWGYTDAKPGFDHWPRNMFNGFTFSDSWKYAFTIVVDRAPGAMRWPMSFGAARDFTEMQVQFTPIFSQPLTVRLSFDDDPRQLSFSVNAATWKTARQIFTFPQPRRAKTVTVELAEFVRNPSGNTVIGIDNLWLYAKRPEPEHAVIKPLLNIGALVKYQMGNGGIVLNNLRLSGSESNPVNAQKKRTIVSTLLRNMGATVSGAPPVVPGGRLTYRPIALEATCNAYLTREHGWFESRDLGMLPKGDTTLAGVQYLIRDFRTSPLPSCVMLAGPGAPVGLPTAVTGIPIGGTADALFFLHTAHVVTPWQAPNQGDGTPPIEFVYTVHYADGQTSAVPIRYNLGVGSWHDAEPRGLPEAAVAWAAPFFGSSAPEQAVVYQYQWNNPRPTTAIASVDLAYPDHLHHLIPVLLGITAARGRP